MTAIVPPAPRAATKNVIVELVVAGLAQSKLKDTGLSALRGVLLSDKRLAVLDGAVDLQAVWDVLESQPGFDANAALGPFSFVKSLESRLLVNVKLPAAMAQLTDAEITKHAAACRPKREEIERAISGEAPKKKRWSLSMKPVTIEPVERSVLPRWKKALGIGAAAVTLVSLVFLAHLIISELQGPLKPSGMDPLEVSGSIPLKSVERWGNEVHAVLADPTWKIGRAHV